MLNPQEKSMHLHVPFERILEKEKEHVDVKMGSKNPRGELVYYTTIEFMRVNQA